MTFTRRNQAKITNKIKHFMGVFRWSIFYYRRSAEKPGKTAIIGQKRPIYGGFSKFKYRACGSSAALGINTPMRRIRSGCCARAASGHAAAAPPMSVMN